MTAPHTRPEGTHAKATVGGMGGHLARRFIHVCIIFIPIIYYNFFPVLGAWLHLNPKYLVLAVLLAVIIFEMVRIKKGKVLFAQRFHEATHMSSFGWGMVATCLVLLLVPGKQYAYPILIACAVGDPLLGELRRLNIPNGVVALLGVIVVACIWWLTAVWLPIAWWLPLVMGPVTVAAEWPNLKWIDDNAMIQLVPLIVILIIQQLIIG